MVPFIKPNVVTTPTTPIVNVAKYNEQSESNQ